MRQVLGILAVLSALFLPVTLSGGNIAYRSDRLAEIASLIDGATSWKGCPLSIDEQDGTIEHIGYRFFSDSEKEALGKEVSRFLERYALECDLHLEKEKSVEMRMLEDGIVFRSGNLESLKTLCDEEHGNVELICMSEQRYLFRWKDGEVAFPSDVELLTGRNQIENGRRLPSEIISSTFRDTIPVPSREKLKQREDGILVLPGENYMYASLSGDTYFNDDLLPVNDILKEDETIANIFSGLIRDIDVTMEVRMNVYGLKQERFSCLVTSIAAYALENGCKPFVGIIARDRNEIEFLVIYRNIAAAYNHVLRIQTSHSALHGGKGTATARLTPFVPTHSIKYLFEELNK